MSADDKLAFLLALQDEGGGAIPFERWMREALYHPQFGYYTARIRTLGRRGDFTTWPHLHDSLARGIARWALDSKPSGRWHLIEIGAGTGELAAGLLRAFGWWKRPHYHIVEVSGPLRAGQRERLGRRARWHASVGEALQACEGEALILSNELVDAFPCRIFRRRAEGWRELALRLEQGRVIECWLEAPLPDSSVFEHAWPEGQTVEVQPEFCSWFSSWRPAWRRGAMLTIDYGDTCPELYHRRPRGTLRAYAHHQRLEGPDAYGGFGLRDLTVDVNFSDLARWIPNSAAPSTLADFLSRQGVADTGRLGEAGQAFKVLESRPER